MYISRDADFLLLVGIGYGSAWLAAPFDVIVLLPRLHQGGWYLYVVILP